MQKCESDNTAVHDYKKSVHCPRCCGRGVEYWIGHGGFRKTADGSNEKCVLCKGKQRVNLGATNAAAISLLDRCDTCFGSCYPQINPNPKKPRCNETSLEACNELIIFAVNNANPTAFVGLPGHGCSKCYGAGIKEASLCRCDTREYFKSL